MLTQQAKQAAGERADTTIRTLHAQPTTTWTADGVMTMTMTMMISQPGTTQVLHMKACSQAQQRGGSSQYL
jgi:hypothetical protein